MKCKIEGDKAIIRKEDIEAAIAHYEGIKNLHRSQWRQLVYYGKIDILFDILKQFDEQE